MMNRFSLALQQTACPANQWSYSHVLAIVMGSCDFTIQWYTHFIVNHVWMNSSMIEIETTLGGFKHVKLGTAAGLDIIPRPWKSVFFLCAHGPEKISTTGASRWSTYASWAELLLNLSGPIDFNVECLHRAPSTYQQRKGGPAKSKQRHIYRSLGEARAVLKQMAHREVISQLWRFWAWMWKMSWRALSRTDLQAVC